MKCYLPNCEKKELWIKNEDGTYRPNHPWGYNDLLHNFDDEMELSTGECLGALDFPEGKEESYAVEWTAKEFRHAAKRWIELKGIENCKGLIEFFNITNEELKND